MKSSPLATLKNNTQRFNAKHAVDAKTTLRLKAAAWCQPLNVFEGFYGSGEMRKRAWSNADYWVGCDTEPWKAGQEPRLVGDNRIALRSLDLGRFNVFDLDAFGSPWDQLLIISERRQWDMGEHGSIVITDGTSMNLRLGSVPKSLAQLVGVSSRRSSGNGLELQSQGLLAWCEVSHVRPVDIFSARGDTCAVMKYSCVNFEGL